MLGKSFPQLKASELVRTSKLDIIDFYDIFPIKIGEGNDSVVYKAKQHHGWATWRAVKKIHRKYIDKEEYINNEITILKTLDHPGILKAFEVFDDDEYIFIVTELCQGACLANDLAAKKKYSEQQARQIFRQILETISYCHQNNVMHRDLKPQNLMFADQSCDPLTLKIIDFGMSFMWEMDARKEIENTFSTNKIVGTIYYMAPQLFTETSYDQRSDIWSLAVILFSLVSGNLPFYSEDDSKIQEQIKARRVPFGTCLFNLIGKLNGCSPELKDLLQKMFQIESKRISVWQIFKHPWMSEAVQIKLSIPQKKSIELNLQHKFQSEKLLISEEEKKVMQQKKKIEFSQKLSRIKNTDFSHSIWINIYNFIISNNAEKALRIFLAYRMPHQKIVKYQILFERFSQVQSQQASLEMIKDCLIQEMNSQMVKKHKKQWSKQDLEKVHHYQENDIDEEQMGLHIIKFLDNCDMKTISFSQFVAWTSSADDFHEEELKWLTDSLNQLPCGFKSGAIQKLIRQIHKLFSGKSQQQKQKQAKTQRSWNYGTPPKNPINWRPNQLKSRYGNNLTVNLGDSNDKQIRSERKKKVSIKQSILESFSPTFKRKSNSKMQGNNQIKQNSSNDKEAPSQSGLINLIGLF